jgi:hypothetical protein
MRQYLFKYYFLVFLLTAWTGMAHADFSDIARIYRQTPYVHDFEVCAGGGCAELKHVSMTHDAWQTVVSVFTQAGELKDAAQERVLIAQAIGVMESVVGTLTDTATDLAGTFGNADYPGQMDCNDEAINTTTYMRLMRNYGLIRFHEIEDMRTRNFFFNGWPHSTAVIRETASGARFAVDSWFYDNGFPATIVPFSKWKSGYIPEDSPLK